jgi:hypothetical protein
LSFVRNRIRIVEPTEAPSTTGAVAFADGGVADGSAPLLVTSAGGGAAETDPVAVVIAGAVSVTIMVELSSPEVVEIAVVELITSDAIVLVIVLLSEDAVLEVVVPICPFSQMDKVIFQESARVQRSSWLAFGAFASHSGRVSLKAAANVQSTSNCHARTMMFTGESDQQGFDED